MPVLSLAAAQEVGARAWFPVRHSAERLPGADARREDLRNLGFNEVSATLHVCVGADGKTREVRLEESSGVSWFDEVVKNDVGAWHYEPFRAPTDVRVCEPMTITYLP